MPFALTPALVPSRASRRAHATRGGDTSTPRSLSTSSVAGEHEVAPAHPLGLLCVQNGYVVSVPRWIQPSEEGVEIGPAAPPSSTPATSSNSANPPPTPSCSAPSSRQLGTFLSCRYLGTLLGASEPVVRGWRDHSGLWRSPEVNLYRPPIFAEITLDGGVQ